MELIIDMKAEELVALAVRNVKSDRSAVQVQINDLNKSMTTQADMSKHSIVGMTFAKYAETLQRSNDQLIKLADLSRKLEEHTREIEDEEHDPREDADNLYKQIAEEVEE